MATKRKLKSWKYKKDWPTIREVLKGDRIKFKVDTTTKLGKRYQPVFATKEEAEIQCEQFRIQLRNQGTDGFKLSTGEREDAYQALEKVRAMGFATLTQAADELAKYHKPPKGDITVAEFREEFLEHHKQQLKAQEGSERHYRDLKSRTKVLVKPFGDLEIKFLTGHKVWDELKKLQRRRSWSRQNLQNYCRVLTNYFNVAVSEGYLAENPLLTDSLNLDKKATLKKYKTVPSVVSATNASKILREAAAVDEESNILAFVVLGMFCGLRPEAEIIKLDWEDVLLEEGEVHVKPNKGKNPTGGRIIDIPECAKEWLLRCDQSKPIQPFRWQFNWKRIRDNAEIGDWKPDTLRHSFASYSYALHRNKQRLVSELGHVNQQMLTHYLQVSPKVTRDAKQYFDLTPDKVLAGEEEKVVEFEKAAG